MTTRAHGSLRNATPRGALPRVVAALLLAGGSLVGCKAVGPNFSTPQESIPDRYAGPAKSSAAQPAADSGFWWQNFHDPVLNLLETRATVGNLDLKVAYLRIVESRIQVQQARAQGLPSIDASAKYTREQLGAAGLLKSQGTVAGSTSPATQQLLASIEKPVNLWQIGFDASWEFDLFGKVRRTVEAAQAQSAEAVESRNDLLVTLQAEVAQTYLQARAGQVQQQFTRRQIDDQREIYALTEERHAHGLTGQADVESAHGQLASLEAQLPPYDQTVAGARHALAVLTGEPPEALDSEFGTGGELPELPPDVDAGVPASLARRRPDIRSSEAALHAATAQIGVSVAGLFPDVSLSGTYGLRNLGTRYLFDWASRFYTAGPAISLPIFHGGSLLANVKLARAQAAEAALNYRKTVLTALKEVEDGLTGLDDDMQRTAALKETLAADQRAFDIDDDAYRRGLVTYVTVLTAQVQTLQAQQQLAQAMLTQSTDLVKLYKALGGGWEHNPDLADASGVGRAEAVQTAMPR